MHDNLKLFLSKNICDDDLYKLTALEGGASQKSFDRICLADGSTRILCSIPLQSVQVVDCWLRSRHLLSDMGISVPEVYAVSEDRTMVLMEDFGDRRFSDLLRDNRHYIDLLYKLSVDVLTRIHSVPASDFMQQCGTMYSVDDMLAEACKFVDYYMPATASAQLSSEARSEYIDLWREVINKLDTSWMVLTLRDYHSPNLFYLPEREGIKAIGVLDLEDAAAGVAVYDLVSLLHDARVFVPFDVSESLLKYYMRANSAHIVSADKFYNDYYLLSLHRNLKILGFVMYQKNVQQNNSYNYMLDIVRRYIGYSLARVRGAGGVRSWLLKHCPELFKGH